MSEQVVIAIGTAILAIVALFQDFIRSWLKTPFLEVKTGSCTPYCKKLLFIGKNDPNERADGYALRIRVKNVKPFLRLKSRAEKVEVFALRLLRKQPDSSFQSLQGFDPCNLIWSHSFRSLTDISPEMERYCFIGRMVEPRSRHDCPDFDNPMFTKPQTCLRIDVETSRHTKEHIIQPGIYRIECLIGSADTKALKKTFEIHVSGEWFDDEIKMYEKGLSIKDVS